MLTFLSASLSDNNLLACSIHLRAAKLRMQSYAEQRKRLESVPDDRAIDPLKRLNVEVSKTITLIADLQKSLDPKLGDSRGPSKDGKCDVVGPGKAAV